MKPFAAAVMFASLMMFCGSLSAGEDPFGNGDPFGREPAAAPVPVEGMPVEGVPAERPLVVEPQLPQEPPYETEVVAITPRAAWMLNFPGQRLDLFQSRMFSKGFIDNRHEWASLWVLCRGTEPLPRVDFTRELVVYYMNTSLQRLPAVAYATDGNLSLQEMHTGRRVHTTPKGFLALHAQVIPREGLVRFVNGKHSLLIPGGYLAEPLNPTHP